jgi:hypothetical protein
MNSCCGLKTRIEEARPNITRTAICSILAHALLGENEPRVLLFMKRPFFSPSPCCWATRGSDALSSSNVLVEVKAEQQFFYIQPWRR